MVSKMVEGSATFYILTASTISAHYHYNTHYMRRDLSCQAALQRGHGAFGTIALRVMFL